MNEGKKDRRDPIRTIKARNPVAKNATSAIGGGAAGAHKDKKKAAKQGDVKHKKAEYAESYEDHLKQILKTKLSESQTFVIHFADMDTDETDTASVIAPDINTARKIFSRENPELYIERIRPAGTQFARHDFGDEIDEADETSWTANSAQFRKEEDLSWPVEVTLEPRADVNQGRGAQVKTMTVTGQSRDAAKKKLVDYFRKNGWEVTGIKFTGDLDEDTDELAKLKKKYQSYSKSDLAPAQKEEVLKRIRKEIQAITSKQGVAEDVSRLSDAEYNRVAGYVRKKYPGAQLSGLGRNEDGSFNVMIDTGSGRHQFKVRFRDPEETKLAELSPDTLKSYIKKSKGHSQKYDQKGNKADEKGDEELANKMWHKGDNRYAGAEQARVKLADLKDKKKGVAEDFDSPEYNDEAGMAQSNLYTLARAVKGLLDTIEKEDNLPEWAQEKIAKSEMMLVSVWDYLLSQKSQGIDPKVSEASALEKFRKGSAEREKKHADIEAKRKANPGDSAGAVDRLAKHMDSKTESLRTENPCWKGYKPVGTKKKGGKTVPNCVPKEGWTHDSLADELFEHERTYEEKLQNQLNNKLGK